MNIKIQEDIQKIDNHIFDNEKIVNEFMCVFSLASITGYNDAVMNSIIDILNKIESSRLSLGNENRSDNCPEAIFSENRTPLESIVLINVLENYISRICIVIENIEKTFDNITKFEHTSHKNKNSANIVANARLSLFNFRHELYYFKSLVCSMRDIIAATV